MKKLLILIILNLIFPLALNAMDVNTEEPQKSFEIQVLKERVKILENDIEYKRLLNNDSGYIYNIDQIYANSLRYYEETIEDIKWFISIIGFLFLTLLGYTKWDNDKKFKDVTRKLEDQFREQIKKNNDEIVAIKAEVYDYTIQAEFNSRFSNAMSKISTREKIAELKKLKNERFKTHYHLIYSQIAYQCNIEKEYNRAKFNYNEALKLCPGNKKLYLARGRVKENLNELNDALDDYNRAIEIDFNDPESYMTRGMVHEKLKHYKEALSDYNYVLKSEPLYKQAYVSRAIVKENIIDNKIEVSKRKLKNYKEALDDYETLFCLDNNSFDGYIARASLFYKLKKYDDALKDSQKAIKLNYNCEKSHRARGRAFLGINEYAKALRDFTKCIEINSEINFHIKIEFDIYIKFSEYLKALENKNELEQEVYRRLVAKEGFTIIE